MSVKEITVCPTCNVVFVPEWVVRKPADPMLADFVFPATTECPLGHTVRRDDVWSKELDFDQS